MRSTAPDSVGAVLAASMAETIWFYFSFFGAIIVMTVLIVEPVSLELNKIRTGHNLATDLTLTQMEHQTTIYVINDVESVLM
jgi:hypothetical protein